MRTCSSNEQSAHKQPHPLQVSIRGAEGSGVSSVEAKITLGFCIKTPTYITYTQHGKAKHFSYYLPKKL